MEREKMKEILQKEYRWYKKERDDAKERGYEKTVLYLDGVLQGISLSAASFCVILEKGE